MWSYEFWIPKFQFGSNQGFLGRGPSYGPQVQANEVHAHDNFEIKFVWVVEKWPNDYFGKHIFLLITSVVNLEKQFSDFFMKSREKF